MLGRVKGALATRAGYAALDTPCARGRSCGYGITSTTLIAEETWLPRGNQTAERVSSMDL